VCKSKNLRYSFKATLTLGTRIGYICNIHGYQKGIFCHGFEMKLTYITIRWDTASWCVENSCEKPIPVVLLAVIDGQIQVCIRVKDEVGQVP